MKEATFQTMWRHFLEENPPNQMEVYELKLCKTNRFPFSAVKDHQIEGLKMALSGLFHKISDSPIFAGQKTRFTAKKPFDCLWIKANAYVCIMYYIPRKRKQVVKISLSGFMQLKHTLEVRSITFAEFLKFKEIMPSEITIINLGRK